MAGGVGSSSAGPPRSVTEPCPCVRRPADNACGGGNGGSEQRHRSQVGPLRVSPCPRLAQEHPSPGGAEPQGAAEPWPDPGPMHPGQMDPGHGRPNFLACLGCVGRVGIVLGCLYMSCSESNASYLFTWKLPLCGIKLYNPCEVIKQVCFLQQGCEGDIS